MSTTNMAPVQATQEDNAKQEITSFLDRLDKRTNETDTDLRHLQLIQGQYEINYQNQETDKANLAHVQQQRPSANLSEEEKKLKQEIDETDKKLLALGTEILQRRQALAKKHQDTLLTLESIRKRVVDGELNKWKQKQKLGQNGAPFDTTLIDVIQKWCEALADITEQNRKQINKVDFLREQLHITTVDHQPDLQPDLKLRVLNLLKTLVKSTFVVEMQPPQVLQIEKSFKASVRWLIGGKINPQLNPPRVKATIISEQQARNLLQNENAGLEQKCGNIINNEGSMEYNQHLGRLSITLSNMVNICKKDILNMFDQGGVSVLACGTGGLEALLQKDIQRAKRGTGVQLSIKEKKYCVLFLSEIKVGGQELTFPVWTLSLPVVVTTHGNQECESTATYLWDNQFSEPGRIPFQVPDRVPWSGVANMLSSKFCAMTGRGLNESNLKYLGNKLFGTSGPVDLSRAEVTWAQFYKTNFPGKSFTFWTWFWSIGKLVKEHLKGPWTEGSVIGFMDKLEANQLIRSQAIGTFLVRFSESVKEGITIVFIKAHENKPGKTQTENLAPLTDKDLGLRSLADSVMDLTQLKTLYPNTPKEEAFQRYCSPSTTANKSEVSLGYIKTKLQLTVIDGQQLTQPSEVMDFNNTESPQVYAGPTPSPSCQPFTPAGDSTPTQPSGVINFNNTQIPQMIARPASSPFYQTGTPVGDSICTQLSGVDFNNTYRPTQPSGEMDFNNGQSPQVFAGSTSSPFYQPLIPAGDATPTQPSGVTDFNNTQSPQVNAGHTSSHSYQQVTPAGDATPTQPSGVTDFNITQSPQVYAGHTSSHSYQQVTPAGDATSTQPSRVMDFNDTHSPQVYVGPTSSPYQPVTSTGDAAAIDSAMETELSELPELSSQDLSPFF